MAQLPATVAQLDTDLVVKTIIKHKCSITNAARELGVPPRDLRRLLWAYPHLQDAAAEVVEERLDTAEQNITEALHSEDSRRRDAASFFVLRNTGLAKRRGWITSSPGAEVSATLNVAGTGPQEIIFRWRAPDADEKQTLATIEGEVAAAAGRDD